MARFFSFSRNQMMILVTLLFVLIAGAVYFFIYIPGNMKDVDERRFRTLRTIEENVHSKIENSIAVLNNLIDAYNKNAASYNRDRLKTYIDNYPTEQFHLDSITKFDGLEKIKGDDSPNGTYSTVDIADDEIRIQLIKWGHKISLRYTIKQFIEPLCPRSEFDEYVLFKNDKKIYQTFSSGVTSVHADSLVTSKSAFVRNQIKDVTLSGTKYQLFSQQIALNYNTSITVSGLLSNEEYQSEINALPDNVVWLLTLIAIAIILALPWIKLYQMGSQDRLTIADAGFSIIVSMLFMSLTFFVMVKYNKPFRAAGPDASQESEANLAGQIERRFIADIDSAFWTLTKLDEIQSETGSWSYDTMLNKSVKPVPAAKTNPARARIHSLFTKMDINRAFWLRGDGTEFSSWYAGAAIPGGNYSNRNYFKKLTTDPLYLNNQKRDTFYLEQVISWNTGDFVTVLSKPAKSKGGTVAALSFNPKSLNKIVITAGYQFGIIDDAGSVLYHSNPDRNLKENLLEELSNSQDLKAAMVARSERYFTTRYLGKEYKAFVQSIPNYPYHIVVFEDVVYKNIRDVRVGGFTLSVLFAFLVLVFLLLGLAYAVSSKQAVFKKSHSDISWMLPDSSLHREYNVAAGWNMLSIVVLIIYSFFISVLVFVLLLILTVVSVALFYNILLSRRGNNPSTGDNGKERLINTLWVIIGLINIIAIGYFNLSWCGWLGVALFQGILLFIGWFCLSKYEAYYIRILRSISPNKDSASRLRFLIPPNWNFSRSYAVMVYCWLILVSGLPVVVFYKASYNFELKLLTRYRHTQFAKDWLQNVTDTTGVLDPVKSHHDGIWVCEYDLAPALSPKKPGEPDQQDDSAELLKNLVPYNDDQIPGFDQFADGPKGNTISYSDIFTRTGNSTRYRLPSGKELVINSENVSYNLPSILGLTPKNYYALMYWLLFSGMLLLFWQVFHRIIRRLFALDVPSENGWDQMDKVLLANTVLNHRLFVIGSPGSRKLDKLKDMISNGTIKGPADEEYNLTKSGKAEVNVYIADMILIPNSEDEAKTDPEWIKLREEAFSDKYALVIVSHFEYDLKNLLSNSLKLNFLETLLQKNKHKVIILSTVHPINFLDSLNQSESAKDEKARLPFHDLERWHVLLGHFRIAVERLSLDPALFSPRPLPVADLNAGPNQKPSTKLPVWSDILYDETKYSKFLKDMYTPFMEPLLGSKKDFEGDALAFKVQLSSHYFYMYIWQSLTREEKFLLYDLAEDGLVNPFDHYNLSLLINKGLIIRKHGILRLFNKGFRNFILTAIGATEAMQIKKQISNSGNWNKLRTPLIILILAVFTFLVASQREAFSPVFTYLSLLVAAIPAVLKFMSAFPGAGQKTE